MKNALILPALLLLPFVLAAQYHLDIEGDARIQGNLEISHQNDSSSLYIGRQAAMNLDTNGLISPRYNTYIGLRVGQLSKTGNFNTSVGALSARSNEGFFNAFFGFEAGSKNNASSNSFFGFQAGRDNTDGSANTFIGHGNGTSNIVGNGNTFLGTFAGYRNDSANYNTYLGYQSGQFSAGSSSKSNTYVGANSAQIKLNGEGNTFVGSESGKRNRTGDFNTLIGAHAGEGSQSTNLSYCTFIGYQSGRLHEGGPGTFVGTYSGANNSTGEQNTFLGTSSGLSNSAGSQNTFVGHTAGFNNVLGSNNTFVGANSGSGITDGDNNICLGKEAGPISNTANRLFIDIQKTDKPLIYGEFDQDLVKVYGNLSMEKNQSVLRMETLNHNNGSVLVLRNSTLAPQTIGAINFENAFGQTRGQISYTVNNDLSFRVNNIEPFMLLSANGDHIQMSNGARLTAGGVWTNSCSATLKNLNSLVDQSRILQQIKDLPIYAWTYKSNPQENHVGPTAEDFYALFSLGESDKNISGVDLGGITLAAIKALADENEQLKKELAEIKKHLMK